MALLGDTSVLHYSIPAFDEVGGPVIQPAEEIDSDKLAVQSGDVLISRLNPRKSRVQIVRRTDPVPVSSTEFVVLRPFGCDTRYLCFLLGSAPSRQRLDAETRSVTRSHQRVEPSQVLGLRVPIRDRQRQGEISAFLDRECERIAELLRIARSCEERLREPALSRFASLTENQPQTQVGHHYDVQLGKMLDDGKATSGELVPYLRNQNVDWDSFDLADVKSMPLEAEDRRKYAVQAGDLLACEGRHVGKCAIWPGSDKPIYYQKALHRVRPLSTASNRYLLWCLWLGNTRGDFYADGTGSTIPHLPAEKLRRVQIAALDRREQDAIVAEIDDLSRASTAAGEAIGQLGRLLNEYRESLITEAVTGQLDVSRMSDAHADERLHEALESSAPDNAPSTVSR